MVTATFRYDSRRARFARLGRRLEGALGRVLVLSGIVMIGGGVVLLGMNSALGWTLLGCSALPLMLVEWSHGALHDLKNERNPQTVDDILAGEVLGLLPAAPSPADVARAIGRVHAGQFIGARFGLTPQTLLNLASDRSEDGPVLFDAALTAAIEVGSEQLTAPILILALMRTAVGGADVMAHLGIDTDDLINGIKWQQHLRSLVDAHGRPQYTGGLARDWSFGYTPLLNRFGRNVSREIGSSGLLTVSTTTHREAHEQLRTILGGRGRQNVALVGATGVGKTTIVESFAAQLLQADSDLPTNLKFRQIIMLDASSLLSAASGRGELEQLVNALLGEAYAAKNIILCLDNAQLFFEEGVGSVDISNILLPILEAGRLRIILTLDEQRFLQIAARNAALANALNRVVVTEANEQETMAIMQEQLLLYEFRYGVMYMYQALKEAYRLSERYVHDLSMPGRSLKLLEAAATYAQEHVVTQRAVQQAIEQTLDVKVGVANDQAEREKLLNLETLIHQRMINQTRAVSVVSDALRRARAGVRNQSRPVGAFLFLGPTGVGKTELAKALADVYFGGEERLIRLDLNEYVRTEDVARLIADGADDPHSLTAQIMKQPFSVVLLDEIEKAHPDVLTTLLQLLDEGILRDIKNREISFRDSIVIATSNAGAERIREYIERGYELTQFEAQITDELISSNQFRPEFLNRFDEIVVFRPLTKDELLQVVDLIITGINKTLALQKVSVAVDDDAKRLLVDAGYDPRLGARPMRRVVQRAVENTVARQLLGGTVAPGETIHLTAEQIAPVIDSHAQAERVIAQVPPAQ